MRFELNQLYIENICPERFLHGTFLISLFLKCSPFVFQQEENSK